MIKIINIILLSLFLHTGDMSTNLWNELSNRNYISYGDSIAVGTGVENGKKYSSLVADSHELILNDCAVDGMNSDDLLETIQSADLVELANAQLITVSIGASDIVDIILPIISDCYDITTLSMNVSALIDKLEDYAIRAQIQAALDNFESNYHAIINILAAVNRNVYVLNLYNPFSSIVVYDTSDNLGKINIGLYAEEWIDKINEIITDQDKVTIVDINTAFEVGNDVEKLVNAEFNLIDFSFNFNSYPTEAGQQNIHDEINATMDYVKDDTITTDQDFAAIRINVFIIGSLSFIGLLFFDIYLFLTSKMKKNKNAK